MKRLIFLVFLLMLVTGCNTEDINSNNPKQQVTLVETTSVKKSTLEQKLELMGQIVPQAQIPLFATSPLTITGVHVQVGQKVEPGELLITLNDKEAKRQVRKAKETVQKLEKELSKAKKNNQILLNNRVNSQKLEQELTRSIENSKTLLESMNNNDSKDSLIDIVRSSIAVSLKQAEVVRMASLSGQTPHINTHELEAQLHIARETVRQAELTLDSTKITAPISGVVAQLDTVIGQTVIPNNPLAVIVDLTNVNATFPVNGYQVPMLTPGLKATMSIPGISERIAGVINTVSPLINPEMHSFTIQIPVSNKDLLLKGGMKVAAIVNLGSIQDATVISADALLFEENQPYTFVVEGNQVRRQRLELGTRDENVYQVLKGVEIGDTVVTAGKQQLVDGSVITTQSE